MDEFVWCPLLLILELGKVKYILNDAVVYLKNSIVAITPSYANSKFYLE